MTVPSRDDSRNTRTPATTVHPLKKEIAVTIVADLYRHVIGVDTHSSKHQYAILDASGRVQEERAFPATPAGIARAASWIGQTGPAGQLLASVDGAGSYGRQLALSLTRAGVQVVEAPTIRYRPAGKDDRIDARTAASSVLPLDESQLTQIKTGPHRDAAQILLTAREAMTRDRTRAINALTALLRRYDLGIDARKTPTAAQITRIAKWRERPSAPIDQRTARQEATRLARSIRQLTTDLAASAREMKTLAAAVVPRLLDEHGIGPVTALQIYASWSHPGRVRSEAAFARLAGTAPKPASSGNTTRHRLDRGGDRRLNAAIHRIAITRWRNHPDTIAYRDRRRAQGRTDRDIRRILKRYITRDLYKLLQTD